MKKTKRLWALLLAMVMALGLISTAFAAPTIDSGRKASLSLYKYDITAASEDGAWNTASYVSTGVQDDAVTDKLAQYAIQGVEFTYLRVADIAMNNELVDGQRQVGVLYGFAEGTVLQAIGLTAADAHKSENGTRYYTADKLNKAMSDALTANATTVKNALEAAARNGGKAMPETDENGHSKVSGLEQGLYLVVETRVPENVTSTCNPFFVSLPMTTIDGKDWNYDVTVYPKNQTGSPDLEKTVREDKNSTGKNGGTGDIADGYAHTATASVGDVVDYQIISTLPTITSKATSLTTYTFADTMSEGIRYNRSDVIIEFFRDAGCTDQITSWDEDSGKFTVIYDDAANTMTIGMTETGLADINESASVYTDSVKRGYSDCTMRITYTATLTADAQLGDTDNPNEVVLTWKRTNTGYFDTLQDCCHVYTYGVDVLKQFSDGKGDLANVHFLLHNDTDGYFVTAELVGGVYYVTGHEAKESKATVFVPNGEGHIRVMGLEDDTYTMTETATDKGYVLLKDGIEIIITAVELLCYRRLLTEKGVTFPKSKEYGTKVLVAVDGVYQGYLLIADTIKTGAENAVRALRDSGIETVMLTGDAEESAKAVAGAVGIREVHAGLLPQQKLERLQSIRETKGAAMFVGDGINDAPVLAGADVGAAMGSGADAAIEAADVVFMTSDVAAVPQALRISGQTARIAWQNVVFALAVKLAVMILGLCGYASMWLAVIADSGVALLCVLNSIRILYKK